MSCCDNSSITIRNLTTQTWTVTVSNVTGSVSGISTGDTIAPGGTLSGSASSGNGTDGIASGNLAFANSENFTTSIAWEFQPDSKTGACPCMTMGKFASGTGQGNTQYAAFFAAMWPGVDDGDAGFECVIVAYQT